MKLAAAVSVLSVVAACSDPPRQDVIDASVLPAAATATTPEAPACPAAAPTVGGSCPCAFACEYGSDPDLRCDTLMTGSHDQWVVSVPPASAGCGATQPDACPVSYAALVENGACDAEGATCVYPQARCTCSRGCGATGTGDLVSDLGWCCPDALVPRPDCPPIRPRIGAACPTAGVACDYGACAGNVNVECIAGVWENVPIDCSR